MSSEFNRRGKDIAVPSFVPPSAPRLHHWITPGTGGRFVSFLILKLRKRNPEVGQQLLLRRRSAQLLPPVQAPISDRPINVPLGPTSARMRSTSVGRSISERVAIACRSMAGNCVSTRSVTRCTDLTAPGPVPITASILRTGGGKPASSNKEARRARALSVRRPPPRLCGQPGADLVVGRRCRR